MDTDTRIHLYGFLKNYKFYDVQSSLIGLGLSAGIFIFLIAQISILNKDKKPHDDIVGYYIALSVFLGIGALLSFLNVDPFIKQSTQNDNLLKYFRIVNLFSVPQFFFDLILNGSYLITGQQKTRTMYDSSLNDIGNKYSGRITQITNLGKDDSGFIILNRFRMQKRLSILPCDPFAKNCIVRRSVVYMIFYLAFIVLLPIFITCAEWRKNKKFDGRLFSGYLNLFLAITFGGSLVFVLSTVKNAAGSNVFDGELVDKSLPGSGPPTTSIPSLPTA